VDFQVRYKSHRNDSVERKCKLQIGKNVVVRPGLTAGRRAAHTIFFCARTPNARSWRLLEMAQSVMPPKVQFDIRTNPISRLGTRNISLRLSHPISVKLFKSVRSYATEKFLLI
jgi:hypothetical protein